MKDHWSDKWSKLEEYSTCFCQCQVTVSDSYCHPIGTFYIRDANTSLLEWVVQPGKYVGYYWTPMIVRSMRMGHQVEFGLCWCWREMSQMFADWVDEIISLRQIFKKLGMLLEASFMKQVLVKTIGVMAMKDELLRLTTSSGSEPFLNLRANSYESLTTEYAINRYKDFNANHLTHVAYFVIMMNNVELYDRMLEEYNAGNILIQSNYDAVFSVKKPRIVPGWKLKVHHNFKSKGLRTYESDEAGDVSPGVKHGAA